MQHKRRLVCALLADEGEYLVVYHVVVEHGRHHGEKPAAGVEMEEVVGRSRAVDKREELADIVCLAVPFGEALNPLVEGIVVARVVGGDDVVDGHHVGLDMLVLHTSPDGVDGMVVEGDPSFMVVRRVRRVRRVLAIRLIIVVNILNLYTQAETVETEAVMLGDKRLDLRHGTVSVKEEKYSISFINNI